jgi:alpha-galactosidase
MISIVACLAAFNAFAAGKPLKVFILAGQSNMQGQASQSTLAGMAMDPETKPLYDKLVDKDGKPRVHENVYIASFSGSGGSKGKPITFTEKQGKLTAGWGADFGSPEPSKVGPELAFGVTMYENLNEPILLIKTSWGGKSLKLNFRPPSGGPYYEHPEQVQDRKTNKGGTIPAADLVAAAERDSGVFYRLMMKHVQAVLADPGKYCPAYDPKQGYELAGFFWFQGFNDLVGDYPPADPGKDYSEYSRLLACLIRDVRKELSAPKLPFVIGVMGIGGKTAEQGMIQFRKAMAAPAAMPEFKGNVMAVETAPFWDEKLQELEDRKALLNGDSKKRKRDKSNDKYADLQTKIAPLQKELDALHAQPGKNKGKAKEISKKIEDMVFTPEDQEYIAKNRSNAGYHYLGSAKTYSRIGEACAKALIEMNNTRSRN